MDKTINIDLSRIANINLKMLSIPLLFLIQLIKYMETVQYLSDPSLKIVHDAGVVPYSTIWVALNPWYDTQYPYKYYLYALDLVLTLVQYKLVPRWMFFLYQFTDMKWFTGNYQDITVTGFLPLATIDPLAAILGLAQKLPIGWGEDLFHNPHVQCAIYCAGDPLVHRFDPGHLFTYSMILIWTFLPLLVYVRKRNKSKSLKKEIKNNV